MNHNSKLLIFDEISQKLTNLNIENKTHFDLTNKSTMKIHSIAKLFVLPQDFYQLQQTITICKSLNASYFILGGGSNTIFPDKPFHGIIISTEKLKNIHIISKTPLLVECFCGVPTQTLVNFCTKNCLTGLEEFAGLPGTVGGALYMNARCFEKSINEKLYQTTHLEISKDKTKIVTKDYLPSDWNYKKSPFQPTENSSPINPDKIILSAVFKLTSIAQDKTILEKTIIKEELQKEIQQKCNTYISERKEKGHFKYPSAGSVFKNNHNFGKPSGKIIDEAGLKGTRIGGAQIAPFHANFIININHATANDIKELVTLTQNQVFQKFGYNLEPEILFL